MRRAINQARAALIAPGYGTPPKTVEDYKRLESVAHGMRIESEAKVAYWRKQEGRWRQARIKAEREATQ